MARSRSATTRATVVFPVPGLPWKIICRVPISALPSMPAARRSCWILMVACNDLTKPLTASRPTIPSSFRRARWMASSCPCCCTASTKSASVSIVKDSSDTVPASHTRLVWRATASSRTAWTSLMLPGPLPALSPMPRRDCWALRMKSLRRSSVSLASSLNCRRATSRLRIPTSSSMEKSVNSVRHEHTRESPAANSKNAVISARGPASTTTKL
mmetsp:Transcript_41810/g.100396  ORF Transcript_41810/g.100396 Transcript_41810/m.100396 type:complete len:214 (-) Transcript_41810:1216-1857(-)